MNHDIEVDYSDETALAEAMKRFSVEARESAGNIIEKFTPKHKVWNVFLYMDGELMYRTHYQSVNPPKGGDVWNCVARDAVDYEDNADLADFLEEMGYIGDAKSVRRGIAAYNGCKRTFRAFRAKGVNPADLAELFNEAENADLLDAVSIDIEG